MTIEERVEFLHHSIESHDRQLARLSQFMGIWDYFHLTNGDKLSVCNNGIRETAVVKTYPL
jgi:hypothetical protein